MAKTRELHTTSLLIGMKGTGKSTLLAAIAKIYAGEKVLILDVNDSPAYNGFKEITLDQVPRLRSGIFKLPGTPTKETMVAIAKGFRNGLLIFEDCTKYIEGNMPPEVKTFLVDHRMMGCDIILTFHSILMVPPRMWLLTANVTLLKTNDFINPKERANEKRYPNFQALYAAYQRVNAHKNRYHYETYETYI